MAWLAPVEKQKMEFCSKISKTKQLVFLGSILSAESRFNVRFHFGGMWRPLRWQAEASLSHGFPPIIRVRRAKNGCSQIDAIWCACRPNPLLEPPNRPKSRFWELSAKVKKIDFWATNSILSLALAQRTENPENAILAILTPLVLRSNDV